MCVMNQEKNESTFIVLDPNQFFLVSESHSGMQRLVVILFFSKETSVQISCTTI